MDHVSKLIRAYRDLVTDPAWQAEQERQEAEKLDRFFSRLLEWDGVSDLGLEIPTKHQAPPLRVVC